MTVKKGLTNCPTFDEAENKITVVLNELQYGKREIN